MASMNYASALATKTSALPAMTCTSALAAFNAVMAADPVIVALGERPWGDVVYEEEMEEKRRQAPGAPKKASPPTGKRCMVSGCSFIAVNPVDVDEIGICRTCYANPPINGFKMRGPSEMTLKELEAAHDAIDSERRELRRNGFNRFRMDRLNEAAQEIQTAKDAIVKRLDLSAI